MKDLAHLTHRRTMRRTTANTPEVCTDLAKNCTEKESEEILTRLALHLVKSLFMRWKMPLTAQKTGKNPLSQTAGQLQERHLKNNILS